VFIHNTVPPHPGVTTSSTLLGADLGLVTVCGLLLSIPLGVVAYRTSRWITSRRDFAVDPPVQDRFDNVHLDGHSDGDRHEPVDDSDVRQAGDEPTGTGGTLTATATVPRTSPGGAVVATVILLPILMISVGTVGGLFLAEDSDAGRVVSLVGEPALALLVATTVAIYALGVRHGWGRERLSEIMDTSLRPVAIVVFVTGAGGVFAAVLTKSGIGDSISGPLVDAGVPVLLLAFLLASVFKVAQGSGTVATLTSAGLLKSTVASGAYNDLQVVLIVLAIGCGSVALSHINDSGFWIATRFLGLSVADGLRTWTTLATVLGWSGMVLIGATWVVIS
jgi:gluconate:H+ symporter, GntP family